MSILVDHEIRSYCIEYDFHPEPMISPYLEDQLQPSSYDVKLGSVFQVVHRDHLKPVDLSDPSTFADLYHRQEIPEGQFFSLSPKGFVLGCTYEVVSIPPEIVSRVQGKSSLGRIGLIVETAGYIDPGFVGSLTLEIYNLLPVPIRLWPGMTIAQLSFEYTSSKPEKTYNGKYQGDIEATGSRYAG
jgi:dCTP deaminase